MAMYVNLRKEFGLTRLINTSFASFCDGFIIRRSCSERSYYANETAEIWWDWNSQMCLTQTGTVVGELNDTVKPAEPFWEGTCALLLCSIDGCLLNSILIKRTHLVKLYRGSSADYCSLSWVLTFHVVSPQCVNSLLPCDASWCLSMKLCSTSGYCQVNSRLLGLDYLLT